jgi:hypothetical protein
MFVASKEFGGRAVWGVGLYRLPAGIAGLNPSGGMGVCLLCVLSRRGLCDRLITRPEESYRLCCIIVCDLETSRLRRLKSASGL